MYKREPGEGWMLSTFIISDNFVLREWITIIVIIIAVADEHGIYTMAEVEVGLLLEMNFTLYFMFRSQFAMQKVQSKVIHSCILLLASRWLEPSCRR